MVSPEAQDVFGPSRAVGSSGRPATVDSQWRMFGCIGGPPRKASLDDGLSHFHRRYSERGPPSSLRPPRTNSERGLLPPSRRPDGRRRFDEWISHLVSDGNSVRTLNRDQQQWRQTSNEVRVAPLARVDDDDSPRPGLRVPPSRRNDVPLYSEPRRNDYGTVTYVDNQPSDAGRLQHMNVVFLQAHDEVKRAILPTDIGSLYQVKMAFLRAFPNINRQFLEQPQVKIYIQEPSKSQLFYELEDPRDITDKAVLRLRDHSGSMSPMPFAHREQEYHSEAEVEDDRRVRQLCAARPASAMAEIMSHKPPRRRFDDDSSQSSARSGSTTPVIVDRESRERMETMERQLAGLSTLVHSALVSKGMNERTQKDMAHLRREILALHADGRESSEEPPSIPESLSSHTQHQLTGIAHSVEQAKSDVRQLRRLAQMNAQSARSLINEAGAQIARIISTHRGGTQMAPAVGQSASERQFNEENEAHALKVSGLLRDLSDLEIEVEAVRSGVLNSNKKLRMSEVERLTCQLAQLGGAAAHMKESFGPLQARIEETVKEHMEKVLRNEKFAKEQTSAVDQSLRRCKALANIMVTMKKLAMVQDPSIQAGKEQKAERPREQPLVAPAAPPMAVPVPPPLPADPVDPAVERPAVFIPTPQRSLPLTIPPPPVEQPPPVPPMPNNYISPVAGLDSVLEEVGAPSQPPRPPSRFSVQDVRAKFTKPPELPEQLRSLIEDSVQGEAPPPERDIITERRQELEQRQERLVEKQRQLRSQFMQLQQIGAPPSH